MMAALIPVSCFKMSDSQFEIYADEQFEKVIGLGKRKQSCDDFDDESSSYSVTNDPRGLALILVNEKFEKNPKFEFENRDGINVDVEDLTNLYENQKLQVIQFHDLTGEQMKKVAKQTASFCNEHEVDIFVCVIHSHGSNKDDAGKEFETIAGSDGNVFPTSEIIIPFKICPGLEGKPKLFFIQACRGKREDVGVPSRSKVDQKGQPGQPVSHSDAVPDPVGDEKEPYIEEDPHKEMGDLSLKKKKPSNYPAPSAPPSVPPSAPPSVHLQHSQADFLVMYATPLGYCAYRYTSGGSPFIKMLCAALRDYDFKLTDDSESGTVSLLRILTSVSYKVAKVSFGYKGSKYIEMPIIVPSLTKDVLMKPISQATKT